MKPVMFAAVRRGLFMEELARSSGDEEMRSEMFICGVFSLLDCMMGQPFAELLKTIPVPRARVRTRWSMAAAATSRTWSWCGRSSGESLFDIRDCRRGADARRRRDQPRAAARAGRRRASWTRRPARPARPRRRRQLRTRALERSPSRCPGLTACRCAPHADAAVRACPRRAGPLLDAVDEPLLVFDDRGRLSSANAPRCALLGCEPGLARRDSSAAVLGADAPPGWRQPARCRRTGPSLAAERCPTAAATLSCWRIARDRALRVQLQPRRPGTLRRCRRLAPAPTWRCCACSGIAVSGHAAGRRVPPARRQRRASSSSAATRARS